MYLAVDIGNVLVNLNFDNFIKELSSVMNISKEEAMSFVDRTQQLHDLGFTLLKNELRDHFKIRSEPVIDKLMNEWSHTVIGHSTSIGWLEKMIDKGVKVALLSNMGFEHKKIMPEVLGSKIYNNSIRFISADVGARKPSLAFYHIFLSLYPEFKGCVYIDDNPDNIAAGKYFGFNAIKFDLSQMSDVHLACQKIEAEVFKS